MKKILIVDDEKTIRDGLEQLINTTKKYEDGNCKINKYRTPKKPLAPNIVHMKPNASIPTQQK